MDTAWFRTVLVGTGSVGFEATLILWCRLLRFSYVCFDRLPLCSDGPWTLRRVAYISNIFFFFFFWAYQYFLSFPKKNDYVSLTHCSFRVVYNWMSKQLRIKTIFNQKQERSRQIGMKEGETKEQWRRNGRRWRGDKTMTLKMRTKRTRLAVRLKSA